ncbi:uncharacterized protein NEMAJ01_1748 [Nematocida major]|uniref:uncharacterized protein n=1 Tax=Nematocida major TaxID=1912982 RepID=UPI002007742D|nr:uncharacterized protein NEMAJ01_1748 [Nematocida major]KAH9386852.1 hypothetical protein NEMAJ01_1748 [Nematocida major]
MGCEQGTLPEVPGCGIILFGHSAKILMGIGFSKKSVREAILQMEHEIVEKEAEIKRLKRKKETAGDLFFKVLAAMCVGVVSIVWVCKESLSYAYLLKLSGAFVVAGLLIYAVYYGNQRLCNYMLNMKILALEALREKQRINIESLKKETKYDETHGIIKRYAQHAVKAEQAEEKEENVVDKIVRLL